MHSNLSETNRNRHFFTTLFASLIGLSSLRANSELFEIANDVFSRKNTLSEKAILLKEKFSDHSDADITQGLALWVLNSDNNPRYRMRADNAHAIVRVLIEEPTLISDDATLRSMIRNESNPRKFYLLSCLARPFIKRNNADYISERMRMLFEDGAVAREEGEYTRDYAHDVSVYAYGTIVENLRILGARFQPPSKELPHDEQVMILARWLKKNWPSCADLEIPDEQTSSTNGTRPSPTPSNSSKVSDKTVTGKAQNKTDWPLVAAIVLVLGSLLIWWLMRRSSPTT